MRLFFIVYFFRLKGKLCGIRIHTDLFRAGAALSGNYKAARKKLVSLCFNNFITFTSQKGLVNIYLSAFYNGIGADLVSGRKLYNVIHNNVIYFNFF